MKTQITEFLNKEFKKLQNKPFKFYLTGDIKIKVEIKIINEIYYINMEKENDIIYIVDYYGNNILLNSGNFWAFLGGFI